MVHVGHAARGFWTFADGRDNKMVNYKAYKGIVIEKLRAAVGKIHKYIFRLLKEQYEDL